jgi:predicted dehydrogenase
MAQPKPLNVGLIGYGNSAAVFHLPYILSTPSLRLHAVLQRAAAPEGSSGQKHCTVDYPDATHHRTIEAFCADTSIDLAVVVTGQDVHAEMAIAALKSGKHGECRK